MFAGETVIITVHCELSNDMCLRIRFFASEHFIINLSHNNKNGEYIEKYLERSLISMAFHITLNIDSRVIGQSYTLIARNNTINIKWDVFWHIACEWLMCQTSQFEI